MILIKPIPLRFSKDSSFLDNDIISYSYYVISPVFPIAASCIVLDSHTLNDKHGGFPIIDHT